MAGIRVGGIAVLPAQIRIIPMVINFDDGVSFYESIWMAKHGLSPVAVELVSTRWNQAINNPRICDPMLSPDESLVAYAVIPGTGSTNAVYVIPPDESLPPDQIATSPNSGGTPTGVETSLQPSWHPDSQSLIYRSSIADFVPGPNFDHIYTVDKDGTNGATLFTVQMTGPATPGPGRVYWPQYTFDGSQIAFLIHDFGIFPAGQTNSIYVMDADGSNVNEIVAPFASTDALTPIALGNVTSVIAWYDETTAEYWSINADGTGASLLWTDTDPYWGNPRLAWLPDDSGLVISRRVSADPNPEFIITVLDAGGGAPTDLSPEQRWWGQARTLQPRLFPQDGRIWWYEDSVFASGGDVASVLPDGSDYTAEYAIDPTNQYVNNLFSYHT